MNNNAYGRSCQAKIEMSGIGGGGRRVFVQAGALAPRMIRRRLDQAPGVIMNPPHPPLSLTDASLLACRFALADWCVGAGA